MKLFNHLIIFIILSASLCADDKERILVSSDGKTVYMTNSKGVLFICDANDLAVKKRVWLGYKVANMFFDLAGKNILINGRNTYSASDFTKVKGGEINMYDLRQSFDRKYFAGFSRVSGAIKIIVKSEQYKEICSFNIPAGDYPKFCFSADSKKLFCHVQIKLGDKYEIQLRSYDIAKAKEITKITLPEHNFDSRSKIGVSDQYLYLAQSGGDSIRFSLKDATMTKFKFDKYFWGVSFDKNCKYAVSTNLRSYSIVNLKSLKVNEFKIDKLEGFPEYIGDIFIRNDQSIYAVTSSSRIVKFSSDGKLIIVKPIY